MSPIISTIVLTLDSTKVIGLFLETVRDPEGFVRGLEKAQREEHSGGGAEGRPHRRSRGAGGQPFRRRRRQSRGL